eukprot:2463574-Amphidinium_carterae.1
MSGIRAEPILWSVPTPHVETSNCQACWARVWYTSGTTIERMDMQSNPIAAHEEACFIGSKLSCKKRLFGRIKLHKVLGCVIA